MGSSINDVTQIWTILDPSPIAILLLLRHCRHKHLDPLGHDVIYERPQSYLRITSIFIDSFGQLEKLTALPPLISPTWFFCDIFNVFRWNKDTFDHLCMWGKCDKKFKSEKTQTKFERKRGEKKHFFTKGVVHKWRHAIWGDWDFGAMIF